MLRNYIKLAFRNLIKRKFFSLLNILGLAIGVASCLFIFFFIKDELSYDKFHEDSDSIYRVNWDFKWNNNEGIGSGTPPPLATKLLEEIPEVVSTIRIHPILSTVGRHEDQFFNESKIFAVDGNFFDFFSFQLLEGNPEDVLANPNSVVVSENIAQKYFGEKSPIGQVISFGEDAEFFSGDLYSKTFQVTGVVQNVPQNSHFDFDILTSISSYPAVQYFDWSWVWMQVVTFAKLETGVNPKSIESKVRTLTAKYAPAAFNRIGFSFDEMIEAGGRWNFIFQPLRDIYLRSGDIGNRLGPSGRLNHVYTFSIIAFFILLIASINFMNLSTAVSSTRAKEIGVRKTLGSIKMKIVSQFLVESIVFSAIAVFIAILIVNIAKESFNHLAGKNLDFNVFASAGTIPLLLVAAIVIGLISGSYPGFYLSSFKPSEVLKGKINSGLKNQRQRDFLVVFQFAISIGLIICTLLVSRQLNFVQSTNPGFDKEGIVIISNRNNQLGDHVETFTEILKTQSQILNASVTTGIPPRSGFQDYYKVQGMGEELYELTSYMVDDDFVSTLGIEILEGRGFNGEYGSNSRAVLLNEVAIAQLGLVDPIGKTITYPGAGEFEVIGIIRDFNFWSLHQPISAFALFHESSKSYSIPSSYIVARVKGDQVQTAIRAMEVQWLEVAADTPFEYSFLEEDLVQAYEAEKRMSTIFTIFTLLALFVACMGLLGLTAYEVAKRTKEIGVRRILGASAINIMYLFARNAAKWILLANIIAWPLAYYFMKGWLDNFAYRAAITVDIFLIAAAVTFFIALLTICLQSLRGILVNPIKSLRHE